MELTGYTDRWTVRSGDEIAFHIHCAADNYEARLVRLIHGDENPKGPGRKQVRVPSALDGVHPGQSQVIHQGSFGVVDTVNLLSGVDQFTVSIWIWPTLPGPDPQGIISWLSGLENNGLGVDLH